MLLPLLHLGVLLYIAPSVSGQAQAELDFSESYSLHERPPTQGGAPVLITAAINLRNILDVKEKEQIISLETTLKLYWKDERIKVKDPKYLDGVDSIGPYLILKPSQADSFWMPDVFIDQTKDMRSPTFYTKPASLRVYNDSTIFYMARTNYDVNCDMDFHRFPVDEQYCDVRYESFGFSDKQIKMQWHGQLNNTVNPNISLSQFQFNVILMDSYATDYYDIQYPGLIMRLHLTRQIGYHVVQTYIPSTVFVILAWLSLFIPVESVPGRVGMGMTTLLTLTAMFSSVRQNVPRVSYVSFLDIWMLICMIFVFLCILEFIVATVFLRSSLNKYGKNFEVISKIFLPILFIIFNVCYWPVLLQGHYDGK